jgi:hypothetical protein
MDVCREVEPPEVVFPDGVRVACYLYPAGLNGGVAVQPSQPAVASSEPVAPAVALTPRASAPSPPATPR